MLSYQEILDIVTTGNWSELKGEIEGTCIDCKEKLYDLQNESHKIELAKDVTSFANAEGGFILLGIATTRTAAHDSDEVADFRPFDRNKIDTDQYIKVLNDWVYPTLSGIAVTWKEDVPGSGRGFGVITIPPQSDKYKPFLISKTLLHSGKRADILFGYVERKMDRSEHLKIAELHQLLRDGLNLENRLAEISAQISRLVTAQPMKPPVKDISERVKKTLDATGLNERTYYLLAAYPDAETELPMFFDSGPGTIADILEHPPVIRDGAFALSTLDRAKIIDGDFRRVKSGQRKVVDLYPDGVLVFGGDANDRFLAWGIGNFEQRPKLNTLALIEATYHFFLLYAEVLRRLTPFPDRITLRFQFGNMLRGGDKAPVYLVPYHNEAAAHTFDDDKAEAPTDAVAKELHMSTSVFDPGAAAHAMLERVFRWFGLGSDTEIPYSEEVAGRKVISSSIISKIR